mgnify:CR=1 FL=1
MRVTIVRADDGSAVSASIDLTNKKPDDIAVHFGKVSKSSYRGGTGLSPNTGTYSYINPAQSLPKIITSASGSASLAAIKSYFTDEQVIRSIAGYVGMSYETVINGSYKLLLEPVAYVTYHGTRVAFTATEAALFNQAAGGMVRKTLVSLTHKNLPLAMFLETADLGYPAWGGAKDQKVTDDDIISSLGLGIVRFNEAVTPPVEVIPSDYDYRVDTDVVTAVTVSGGQSDPDDPVEVTFEILGRSYTVRNVYYPEDGQQLAWVKWHTPTTPQKITIKVTVIGGAETSKGTIIANIVDLDENPPPDPKATDRNDTFSPVSVPSKAQKTTAAWSRYYAYWVPNYVWISHWKWYTKTNPDGTVTGYWKDEGEWRDKGDWSFDQDMYNVSLSANMTITPDEKDPTKTGRTMKSGYGINERVTATISGSGEHTDIQNAVTYFPEFNYKKYWRLLEKVSGGYEFKKNEYSTYENRTHFTPVWYPDGSYTPYTWVIDCWTPAGMLSVNLTDSVTIKGNVYDDWHIAKTY